MLALVDQILQMSRIMWVWLSVGNLAHILHCRHEDMRMRSASVLRNRDRFLLLSYDRRGLGGVGPLSVGQKAR